jgi:hypothetical protein
MTERQRERGEERTREQMCGGATSRFGNAEMKKW